MNKRGISPVIATVLLIAMVIVIGLIIFLWFRGIIEEEGTKFEGKNVKLVCADVKFDASYSKGVLSILNTASVPIYKMKMKIYKDGSHSTKEIEGSWPPTGLNPGGAFSEDISSDTSGVNKITLIPVLMASSSGGKKAYTCEDQYGKEITI